MCPTTVCIRAAFFLHSPARADHGGEEEVVVEFRCVLARVQTFPSVAVEGVEVALAIDGGALVTDGGEVGGVGREVGHIDGYRERFGTVDGERRGERHGVCHAVGEGLRDGLSVDTATL